MKNSIKVIKKPEPLESKSTRASVNRKADQYLIMNGRKPCARDGHSAVICEDKMIVFGGDRHMMSFADIHVYQLNSIKIS